MPVDRPPNLERQLRHLFGSHTSSESPLSASGAGCRLMGVDLRERLNPEQVTFLLDALSQYRILCIAGQDLQTFSLAHCERFANHWGAPVPHPNNFMRAGKPAQSDGDSDGPFELIPFERRTAAAVNDTFPGELTCLPHDSPTVLVVANFRGSRNEPEGREVERAAASASVSRGGSWHTDIEYERLPIYVSMFLVHKSPLSRDAPDGTWVQDPHRENPDPRPYFEACDDGLMQLRKRLPLNGETAFADLPPSKREKLSRLQVRRRLNEGDEGWLAPLVRGNPRSGIESLHSPIWASRPRVRPPIEVAGMSSEASRALLDELEAHVLQPRYRYDHAHSPGDVTLWDNYMTLHNSPPLKSNVRALDDVRLLYRLSCKGEPALTLPRRDPPEWLAAHIPGGYSSPSDIIGIR